MSWLTNLNRMKKNCGKTTEQISIESGISKGTLNKIFAGQTKDPQYTTLKAIVNCLGYTIDDLDDEQKISSESNLEDTESWLIDLLVEGGYIKSGEDLTDRDTDFILSWLHLLEAWFKR